MRSSRIEKGHENTTHKMRTLNTLLFGLIPFTTFAQTDSLSKGFLYHASTEAIVSGGEHAPLWLTSNRYGLPSVEKHSAYATIGLEKSAMTAKEKDWEWGMGADIVTAADHTSSFFVQQLYADVRYKHGLLTLGQKQQKMQLKNSELSSGSQTFGINARPYPELRISLPDYWNVPGTRGFLGLKGHLAVGMYTDNSFQKDFTKGLSSYDEDVLMHTKAGYLRFGKEEKPFTVEAGLEMASQFGATHHEKTKDGWTVTKSGRGLSAFWHAFAGGGADATDGAVQNNEGNMLGSWVLRLNYKTSKADIGLYADHFFEDHSAMFLLDYDGYAYEQGVMKKKDSRFLMYPLKDIMLGADVHLKHTKWVTDCVVEYIYTRYQSGPVYTDRTPELPSHIGGNDNYYNNGLEPGWQHWGQTLGNPLYISPIYNDNNSLTFLCNRFTAWYVGIAGSPTPRLSYRVRASWQESLGTYDTPFHSPRRNVSLSAETLYDASHWWKGLSIGAAFGMDRGALLGNSTGGRITLNYTLK